MRAPKLAKAVSEPVDRGDSELLHRPPLLLALIAGIALCLAYATLLLMRDFDAWGQQHRAGLGNLAQQVQQATEQYFRSYEMVFAVLAQSLCVRDRDQKACDTFLARLNASFPQVANFAAADRNGRFFASGRPFGKQDPPQIADEPFFKQLSAGAPRYVMDPHVGPITGETVTGLVVPLRNERGEFDGIIGISMRLSDLTRVWGESLAPPGYGLAIIDRHARLIHAAGPLPDDGKALLAAVGGRMGEDSAVSIDSRDFIAHAEGIDGAEWTVVALVPADGGFTRYLGDKALVWQLSIPIVLLAGLGVVLFLREANSIRRLVDSRHELRVHRRELERKVLERTAELAYSEERFRTLVDRAPIGIALIQQGRLVYVNAAFLTLFGFEEEARLQGRSIGDLVAPEVREEVIERNRRRERGEIVPSHYETTGLRADGTSFPVEVSVARIGLPEGPGTVLFARDISARRQTEESLRLAATVFENAGEGIIVTDDQRRILAVNARFCETTGYSEAEALGRTPAELLKSGLQDDNFYRLMWETLDQRGIWSGQLWNRRKDGNLYAESLTIKAVRGTSGQITHYVGVFMDISDRLRAEDDLRKLNEELEQRVEERTAALQQLNKELEAFSYSVSHDLRAPLRSISGFSQALQEDHAAALDEEGRDYLKRIRSAAGRMEELINDLLGLAQASRQRLRLEDTDLSLLAAAVAVELQERDPDRRMEWRIAENLRAQGDLQLCRILLANLMDNAWKYTSRNPAPRIEFELVEVDGRKAFRVRDNGVGFDMAHAQKIFEPFRRLHSTSEFPGSGIGLATAARIVDRHGGNIWAESRPDEGTSIYFTLGPQPREPAHQAQALL